MKTSVKPLQTDRRSARAQRGLTLIEVTIASVVAALALIAGMSALSQAATSKTLHVGDPLTAFMLAQEVHALAAELPRDPGDGSAARSIDEVLVLEDLSGATFTPPVNARRDVRTDLVGWMQAVSLKQVELENPGEDAAEGAGADTLWELRVTVTEAGIVRGQFAWWMTP
ncbi:MAG: type IV pilus modification PilV family protein [Planctomycetota bacterium]